ncbi:hypothetical protein [Nocardia brasiliensis]|uniref:hypothetical protein n=1 Tax=Nocardia brasiliensis TaxID=37326 RepID=UPI002457D9B2|nr:hypothetical protein [Nocardia brasiliensis]
MGAYPVLVRQRIRAKTALVAARSGTSDFGARLAESTGSHFNFTVFWIGGFLGDSRGFESKVVGGGGGGGGRPPPPPPPPPSIN